jgi:predicted RNase H-like HicB family nuclease
MSAKGYVVLTYEFGKEGRRWTAHCKELGTATFGRSLPEAQRRIREVAVLHLNALEDVGERKRFFREHKIQFHGIRPTSIMVSIPTSSTSFVQPHIQRIPEYSRS